MKQIRQGYSIGCAVQNLTAVCLTGAPAPSPGGGIGRRNGLKHRCPRGRVGSTPTPGTPNAPSPFGGGAFLLGDGQDVSRSVLVAGKVVVSSLPCSAWERLFSTLRVRGCGMAPPQRTELRAPKRHAATAASRNHGRGTVHERAPTQSIGARKAGHWAAASNTLWPAYHLSRNRSPCLFSLFSTDTSSSFVDGHHRSPYRAG